MKINNGSIQRKGTMLYYVVRRGGVQKWVALKTSDFSVAKGRALAIAPTNENEEAWLAHLVRLGREADAKLRTKRNSVEISWDNILGLFLVRLGRSEADAQCCGYARWLSILQDRAKVQNPSVLDCVHVRRIVAALADEYISCRRMVAFFRRCWRIVGLDPSVWTIGADLENIIREKSRAKEFYRRLGYSEIRKLHGYLRENAPDIADMVAIGFFTGLRLSDVAELDTHEVMPDCSALRIVPNKTRKRKPAALVIPLIREAADAVRRRYFGVIGDNDENSCDYGTNPTDGGRFLFAATSRKRPSRRLGAAFDACSLIKEECGRASFHSLRATFISLMDEAGVSPHLTDAITGHGGGGMHARYTQPSPSALRTAMLQALPPLVDPPPS